MVKLEPRLKLGYRYQPRWFTEPLGPDDEQENDLGVTQMID